MTKNERKYIQDTEELLYERMRRAERALGIASPEASRFRAEWGTIYELMDALHIPLKERDVIVC